MIENQVGLSKIDIRDAFFDEIYRIAASDPNVVFLTDDMDAFSLRQFKKDMPNRFINIGVAEQNMINVASGLALTGKKVFAYGIASFVTMRCYEQIKINLCSMNLPVTIIGVGAGFSFGFDGPTHHGVQDLALMRLLPEMTIFNPSDSASAEASAKIAYQSLSPVYIRLDKGTFPNFSKVKSDFSKGYRIIKPLQKINIVSTGYMTLKAWEIIKTLEQKSISIGLIDLYRVKPINNELFSELFDVSEQVITLEENTFTGGIGTILCEASVKYKSNVQIKNYAVQDQQFICYGSREWFHQLNNLDLDNLVTTISSC